MKRELQQRKPTTRMDCGISLNLTITVVMAYVLLAPLFRGLFFETEKLIANAILASATLIWFVQKRKSRSSGNQSVEYPASLLDYSLILVFVAYLLSAFFAAAPRSAVGGALVAMASVCLMWLAKECLASECHATVVLVSVVVSGVIVFLVGLLTGTKVLEYPFAYVGGRLCSSLQYPNSAAAVFMTSYIVAAGVSSRCKGRGLAATLAAMAALVEGLALTQSRGAALVLPFALLILVAGVPKGHRATVISHVAASLVCGTGSAVAAYRYISLPVPNAFMAWVVSTLGWGMAIAVAVGLKDLVQFVSGRVKPSRRAKHAMLAAAGLLLMAGIVAVVRRPALLGRLGPLSRLGRIGLGESGVKERIWWTLDALRIAADRPILGAGAGGWAALYWRYRNYLYFSKEVHNHFSQVLVETGIVGFIPFLGFWVLLAMTSWSIRARDARNGLLGWTAGSAAITMGLHSMMDFNMSLPAVAGIVWVLAGTVSGLDAISTGQSPTSCRRRASPRRVNWRSALVGAVFTLLVVSLSFLSSRALASRALGRARARDFDGAVTTMKLAVTLDPFEGKLRQGLSEFMKDAAATRKDPNLLAKSIEVLAGAVRVAPYDNTIRVYYASVLAATGMAEEALKQAEIAIENDPLGTGGYDAACQINVEVGILKARQGDSETATEWFKKGLQVYDRMNRRFAAIPEDRLKLCRFKPEPTLPMLLAVGRARLLLGDVSGARECLQHVAREAKDEGAPKAEMWLAVADFASGKESEAAKRLFAVVQQRPDMAAEYNRGIEAARGMGLIKK